MAVTIKDIAREAGVSHTTVSRALHNHPAISVETVTRVQQIAEELGYVPSAVARGLKTNRSGVLGVIVRRIEDPYFAEVLNGIEDVLYAEGYSLFLAASNRDPEREKSIVRTMSERRVDGVIITSTQVGADQQRQLERFGVPTVQINNQATDSVPHSVYHDDPNGAQQLTRLLLNLGHTAIGYLGNDNAGKTSNDRLQGFLSEMEKEKRPVPPAWIVAGPNGLPAGGSLGAEKFLGLNERPTAVICFNDMMAVGAIRKFEENGLQIPADISITGFDDIELAAYTKPPLTTFNQPRFEIGQRAAEMLLQLLAAKKAMAGSGADPISLASQPEIVFLRGTLVVRGSTAPPAQKS